MDTLRTLMDMFFELFFYGFCIFLGIKYLRGKL